MTLSDHLRLQEESPVLRVGCEVIDGKAVKRTVTTTDTRLLDDVMQTLRALGLRAVTRKKLVDTLRDRTGRYGYFHLHDDAAQAYVAVTVSPDPVLGVQIVVGEQETCEMVLQSDLLHRIGGVLETSRLPADVRETVTVLLTGKDHFGEPVRFDRSDDRNAIRVRIGYIGSHAFEQPSPATTKR
jgi:hypothetical protein